MAPIVPRREGELAPGAPRSTPGAGAIRRPGRRIGIVHDVLTVRFVLAAATGYLAVALAYVWPLPLHLARGIANDPIDPLLNTWILEWTALRAPWGAGWWDAPAFAPMTGALALSEHLLGLWPISAPLLALGIPAPGVYNLLLIASVALSALAACCLVTHLTGSRAAGLVAGCLFGFAPYRLVQVAHLQILAAWWGPVALLALHRQAESGGWRWAVVFAGSWLLLSLTSGYHLAFFTVVAACVGAWLFLGRGRWRQARPVLVTTACAALVMTPLLLGYRAVHSREGLTRQPGEIDEYAADARHLLQAPGSSMAWGDPSSEYQETAVFPGAAVIGGLVLALWALRRDAPAGPVASASGPATTASGVTTATLSWRPAMIATVLGSIPLALAIVAAAVPGQYLVAGLRLSLTRPAKSLTVAWVLYVLAAAISPPGVRTLRRRGPVALYAGLAVLTWLFTLGPRARIGGLTVLYHAPYAWIMAMPGGLAMRVAPRFWLWTVLALSVVIGFGIAALRRRAPRAGLVAAALLGAVALVDGWPRAMPIAPLPAAAPVVPGSMLPGAPLIELPLGESDRDTAAMWRGRTHGRPVVNGYSGYDPAHYRVLERALKDGDADVLQVLAEPSGLVVAVDRSWPDELQLVAQVSAAGGAATGTDDDRWRLFQLLPRPAPAPPAGRRVVPARVVGFDDADVTGVTTDQDRFSRWHTPAAQRDGEGLLVQLPEAMVVTAVELGQGAYPDDYPVQLRIDARTDAGWETIFQGPTAPAALRAALAVPSAPVIAVPTRAVRTIAVRLVLVGGHAKSPWSVSTLAVRTP